MDDVEAVKALIVPRLSAAVNTAGHLMSVRELHHDISPGNRRWHQALPTLGRTMIKLSAGNRSILPKI
ncbi:MAG: hypothetical protein LC772_04990 [Chloroflexi bacterium]|nr:hypothetical protein [Chloroflexota bacterium]